MRSLPGPSARSDDDQGTGYDEPAAPSPGRAGSASSRPRSLIAIAAAGGDVNVELRDRVLAAPKARTSQKRAATTKRRRSKKA